jgi:glycosyltransferase involved in cell wall biosynthesis
MRVAFITNLCTHYRRPLFEALAERFDVDFFLTSRGNEWYTLAEYQSETGRFAVERTPCARQLFARLVRGDYEVVLANLAGRLAPIASYAAARLRRRRFVLWVGIWAHPGGIVHRLSRPLARHLYRHADAIVCYGPHVADFIRRESGRTDDVICTRQAVDETSFRATVPRDQIVNLRTKLKLGQDALVSFVGRFEEEKGLDVLLHASARMVRPHRLLLAGKGSLEPELRALANKLGIADRVHFAGFVRQEELPVIMQASEVLVLPSISTKRVREAWGLVLNEAMAAGTAVVASTAVGAAAGRLVRDGETGLVVAEGDAAVLADALDRLLGDDAYRLSLARAGSEHVRAWNFEAAVDAFEEAFEGRQRC